MDEALRAQLLEATRQASVEDAVRYVAEGLFLGNGGATPSLLMAVCSVPEDVSGHVLAARRRLAREVSSSDLNTAAVLLRPELISPPSLYRDALQCLAGKCPDGTLAAGVAHRAAHAAQRENSSVVRALAAVAGMTWPELADRAGITSPGEPDGSWTPEGMKAVVDVVDSVVRGNDVVSLPGGIPARPIELLGDPVPAEDGVYGWEAVERMRMAGVPYEVLLAQRVEGGAWRSHRDRTGRQYAHVIADALCELLDSEGTPYVRARNCGGDATPSAIRALVGAGEDQISVAILDDDGAASAAIAISVANDGGSAAKSGARMAQLPGRLDIPVGVVLGGLGWSSRNETADLAAAFGGRMCSEKTLSHLVAILVR